MTSPLKLEITQEIYEAIKIVLEIAQANTQNELTLNLTIESAENYLKDIPQEKWTLEDKLTQWTKEDSERLRTRNKMQRDAINTITKFLKDLEGQSNV